ncbi:DUF4307 domain-containing protein [Arthrobacter tecti]
MSTDHAPVPRVANRYGAPKPARLRSGSRRWLLWVFLGIAVVGTALFSLSVGTPAVSSKDVGFKIDGSGIARVDFEVTKDPEAAAQCAVQVLNESYAIVGWKIVDIPPVGSGQGFNDGRTTSHSVDIRTESDGVSGGVNACWIVRGS